MRPGPGIGRLLGQVGPAGGQAVAVGAVDGPGGEQGGDLAERVAGEGHRRLVERASPQASQATSEPSSTASWLAPGGGQLVGVGVEQERASGRPVAGLGLGTTAQAG